MASDGPCTASLDRPRKNVFHPCSDSEGLVAAGVEGDEASLIEHGSGRLCLTGPGRADQSDDGRVVDDLRGDSGRLLRVALGVEGLELHLATGVGRIVLVDGELRTVPDVSTERGIRAGKGTRHRNRHAAGGRASPAGFNGPCRSPA